MIFKRIYYEISILKVTQNVIVAKFIGLEKKKKKMNNFLTLQGIIF